MPQALSQCNTTTPQVARPLLSPTPEHYSCASATPSAPVGWKQRAGTGATNGRLPTGAPAMAPWCISALCNRFVQQRSPQQMPVHVHCMEESGTLGRIKACQELAKGHTKSLHGRVQSPIASLRGYVVCGTPHNSYTA